LALEPASQTRRQMSYGRQGKLSQLWTECGMPDVKDAALLIQLDFAPFEDC
jgi:hypothetical protein